VYAYWVTAATALHFTSKETSFIYQAQALTFLAVYLLYRLTKLPWYDRQNRTRFLVAMIVFLLLIGLAGSYLLVNRDVRRPTRMSPKRRRCLDRRWGLLSKRGCLRWCWR
jgi:hypothetical protein